MSTAVPHDLPAAAPHDLEITADTSPNMPHDLLGPAEGVAAEEAEAPEAAAEPVNLKDLYAEAVATTWDAVSRAVRQADQAREAELRAMGERLRAEQDRLFQIIMRAVPEAVRDAARAGRRVAVVLRFMGADKLDEFCYLYMLKGPYNTEERAEMRQMGVKPLLQRLRQELQPAGFGVYHAWQRSTNENVLTVTW